MYPLPNLIPSMIYNSSLKGFSFFIVMMPFLPTLFIALETQCLCLHFQNSQQPEQFLQGLSWVQTLFISSAITVNITLLPFLLDQQFADLLKAVLGNRTQQNSSSDGATHSLFICVTGKSFNRFHSQIFIFYPLNQLILQHSPQQFGASPKLFIKLLFFFWCHCNSYNIHLKVCSLKY